MNSGGSSPRLAKVVAPAWYKAQVGVGPQVRNSLGMMMAARISPYVTAALAGAGFWLEAAHSVPGSAAA
jgi:hypothetical protein